MFIHVEKENGRIYVPSESNSARRSSSGLASEGGSATTCFRRRRFLGTGDALWSDSIEAALCFPLLIGDTGGVLSFSSSSESD